MKLKITNFCQYSKYYYDCIITYNKVNHLYFDTTRTLKDFRIQIFRKILKCRKYGI